MMKARSASAASSIRRRSATWTILLDSMCRSRRRASASWMIRARSCGKRGWLKIRVLRFRLRMNARSALSGLKHQKEKRNMDYFAGLDVSVKETSVCIVDDTGKIVREARVASEPEALLQ